MRGEGGPEGGGRTEVLPVLYGQGTDEDEGDMKEAKEY